MPTSSTLSPGGRASGPSRARPPRAIEVGLGTATWSGEILPSEPDGPYHGKTVSCSESHVAPSAFGNASCRTATRLIPAAAGPTNPATIAREQWAQW
jgi:hypothetical protein